ncbi:unnamed protein product [Rotaria sp. Silwood1]|nr:unnamed protein product [Rotaria sp. Silwood1]CAF1416433.1 unnamed protein product [Rotaria sp. Silwood1]
MDESEPSKYIEKIILEILDRRRFYFHQWQIRRIKKFNIARFNASEAAYAFLKQYNGETFVKAQKIIVRYNNQEIRLCVRDLICAEIKWPTTISNQMNRLELENDKNELTRLHSIPSFSGKVIIPMNNQRIIHINGDYSLIDADKRDNVSTSIDRYMSCNDQDNNQLLSMSSGTENVPSSLYHDCRVHQPPSSPQRFIAYDDRSLPSSSHTMDDESHCRSSIFIYIDQIKSH